MITYEILHSLEGSRQHNAWRDRFMKALAALGLVLVFCTGLALGHFGIPAPRETFHPVKFVPNSLYNPVERTGESDKAWNAYPTGGYVLLHSVQDTGPTLRREDLGGYLYAVSGYHQLHCISILRNAWVLLLDEGPEVLHNTTYFPHHPSGAPIEPHVNHCFDYLRQTAHCHADSTLEPFVEEDGSTIQPKGSSGWGVVHQCRDWTALTKWVDEHDALRHGWEG